MSLRKIILILFILTPALCIFCRKEHGNKKHQPVQENKKPEQPKIKKWVNVKTFLRIRSMPNAKSKVVGYIARGTEVSITKVQENIKTIQNKTGYWVFIEMANVSGWIFDGFLSDIKINRDEGFCNQWFDCLNREPPICTEIYNSRQCAEKIEKYRMAKFEKYFKRKGDSLEILLPKHNNIVYKNKDADNFEEASSYHYIRFYEQLNASLVYRQLYEGGLFILISNETGKEQYIHEIPVFSPNEKSFFSNSYCSDISYCINVFELWTKKNGFIKLEYKITPKEREFITYAVWLSDERIYLVYEDMYGNVVSQKFLTKQSHWILKTLQ